MSNSSIPDNDSTETKRAEDAIWHLRTIVESSCDAILSNDFAGTILSWNLAAERMFGYTSEEAVGKSIAVLRPSSEVPGVLERLQQGRPVDHYDTTVTTKAGASLNVSLGVSPILNASGKLFGACTTIRDITELKRTEDSLARLATVFMDSADPILIEDTSGCVIDMNLEAKVAYGYTRKELLGKPTKTIIPVRQHEQADELLMQCLQKGEVRNVEGFRQNRAGKVFPVLLTSSLLTDRHGKPTGVATICKNITNLKRTERAWRRAHTLHEREPENVNRNASHSRLLTAKR
jgi:PAS domain S-box-containing protein